MFKRARNLILVNSNQILFKKFRQYLIPTMITYAALSLNEFVDSMLVSNLLNSDAMAIVGLGAPLILVMAALYSLLGSGGSTVYAIAIGRRDHETAGKSLTCSMLIALIVGVLVLVLGMVFSTPLAHLLCHEPRLLEQFTYYMHVLLLSAPFMIVILTVVSFLPSAGYPGFSTAVNVIANVVNIAMDYVYIKVFHMGVYGAGWATLTGYMVALIVMLAAVFLKKFRMHISWKIKASFAQTKEVLKLGRPDAMNQVGLAIQFAVCNRLAAAVAGANGVVALSLCLQSSSLMSIFVGAMIGSAVPIMSVLHGQRDYSGEASIMKTSMVGQFIVSVAGMLIFMIFAPQAAALYNIVDAAQLALAVTAFRIYALMYIPRDAVIVYYRYLKVIGLSQYSTVLSALDSFAMVVPVVWIMTVIGGVKGLFWGFPVASLLLLIVTVIANRHYKKASDGKLSGILLIENDEDAKPVVDSTISENPEDISRIAQNVQEICDENGFSPRISMRAALAVEEYAIYMSNKQTQDSYADILVRLAGGNVEIDFRSLGDQFDTNEDSENDIEENVMMLRGVASSIETDYLLGMNCTRIIIEGGQAASPAGA